MRALMLAAIDVSAIDRINKDIKGRARQLNIGSSDHVRIIVEYVVSRATQAI